MPQAFYEIASTAAENIQIPPMGIVLEILLDLQRQGVHAAVNGGVKMYRRGGVKMYCGLGGSLSP